MKLHTGEGGAGALQRDAPVKEAQGLGSIENHPRPRKLMLQGGGLGLGGQSPRGSGGGSPPPTTVFGLICSVNIRDHDGGWWDKECGDFFRMWTRTLGENLENQVQKASPQGGGEFLYHMI